MNEKNDVTRGHTPTDSPVGTAATHTPGPWGFVYDGSSVWSVGLADDPQGHRIASIQKRAAGQAGWHEAALNACLITAAPELLAVLKELVDMLRREAPGTLLNHHRFDAMGISANNAIAKAEGR